MFDPYFILNRGGGRTALKVVSYTIVVFADRLGALPAYINTPCRCCGQSDHGLLVMKYSGSNRRLIYQCPLVTIGDESIDADSQIRQNYLKYRACPRKLAELYDYNLDQIESALSTYETKGDGAFLSKKALQEFKEEVRRSYSDKQYSDHDDFGIEEFKNEGLTETIATIFCDLDGVLVDFEEGIKSIFQKPPTEVPKKLMWATVAKIPDFYANLPWRADGKQLWEAIKDLHPIILTAAPKGSWAEKQKRAWVTRELGAQVPMIVSTRKYEHCPPSIPPAILIDDRISHCQAWIGAGGDVINHTTAARTIEQLIAFGVLKEEDMQLDGRVTENS